MLKGKIEVKVRPESWHACRLGVDERDCGKEESSDRRGNGIDHGHRSVLQQRCGLGDKCDFRLSRLSLALRSEMQMDKDAQYVVTGGGIGAAPIGGGGGGGMCCATSDLSPLGLAND